MHDKSIAILNAAMADELAAVHQYMYFHFRCDDLGYDPLSNLFKQTAITEMMHAEKIAERILFLGGEVEMDVAEPVAKIHDVAKMLAKAKKMEADSVHDYNKSALLCAKNGDSVSKQLFEELVASEEGHYDNYDMQEQHLKKFGEQFLALQSIERSKSLGHPGA
jgi:bacterioferritin